MIITDLNDVKSWMSSLKSGQSAILSPNMFDPKGMIVTLFGLLPDNQLNLTINQLQSQTFTITGTTSFLGTDGTVANIVFSETTEGILQLNLSLTYPAQTSWSLIASFAIEFGSLVFQWIPYPDLGLYGLTIQTVLIVGTDQPLSLPVKVEVPTFEGEWILSGDFTSSNQITESALQSLAGNSDVLSLLSTELSDLTKFKLNHIEMAFTPNADTTKHACSWIGFQIEYDADWSFFSNLFTVQKIFLNFRILKPLDPSNPKGNTSSRALEATINGYLTIDSVPIEIGGQFPQKKIYARYPPEPTPPFFYEPDPALPLKLNSVFSYLNLTIPSFFPDIEIGHVDLVFRMPTSLFECKLRVDTPIPLFGIAGNEVTLDVLYVDITGSHDPATKQNQGGGLIYGLFTIGSSSPVTIFLSANYYSQTPGMVLKGTISNLPVGEMIDWLSTKLGIGDLPGFIGQISLATLNMEYDTSSKNFNLIGNGSFPVSGQNVQIDFTVAITQGTTIQRQLTGAITLNSGYVFNIDFTQNSDSVFVASYTNSSGTSVALKNIISGLSTEIASIIPDDFTLELKDAFLCIYQNPNEHVTDFVFGIDLGGFNLSDIPIVGSQLSDSQTLSIDGLRVLVSSSSSISQTDVISINNALPPALQKLPAAGISSEFLISASLNFGSEAESVVLPLGNTNSPARSNSTANSPAVTTAPSPASVPSDTSQWFNIQKSFGPISIHRLGVRYANGAILFLLDADLEAGGLTISLLGLSFGSALSHFDPQFSLNGLGIDYQNGPLEIGGAFLAQNGTYSGFAIIRSSIMQLSGLGSYADCQGHPSFFIYLNYSEPLGGPPYFYVMGLAGGFGYNRSLLIPDVSQIQNFPFVQIALGQSSVGTEDPSSVLQYLVQQGLSDPSIGDYWFAAGIRFLTFQMIDSFALATARFGDHFELDLVGLSTLTIPSDVSNPLAEAQMALKATFAPEDGFLGLSAQLTPESYILSRDCHLTGGFAYYLWFDGDHAGDFVVSLGGYHPSFIPPPHYPTVPRIGLNWQLSSNISIQGYCYFSMTPGYLMAGGGLEAVWSCGGLRAWFTAYADFLLRWKPFYYEADVGVDMGVSYRFSIDLLFTTIHITISVHLGADIYFHGPDFSGVAHIHLWIVSFTIRFGSGSDGPSPIDWPTFKSSFLPQKNGTYSVCAISVVSGLVKDLSGDITSKVNFIINPHTFRLSVASAVPAKTATYGSSTITSTNEIFGISPMDLASTDFSESGLSIAITRDGESAEEDFVFLPDYKNVPESLWGESMHAALNADALVPGVLNGFDIFPAPIPNPAVTASIPSFRLEFTDDPINDAYIWSLGGDPLIQSLTPEARRQNIQSTIGTASAARETLFSTFGFTNADFDLTNLASTTTTAFVTAPQVYT
ncbi:DUF6603 domain-containing protein [Leptospira ilyithenensis]|uniref:DUF6603 domain-containing protein n=1 Tax=Leptospira ilyithenensis TaxID=2484901 RepID=A0A4R9LS28_9LEPT|nr:DUF6603 domain-containing protein [Leptospira ilyithenensis]TGN14064.1 hypothetical protein EHS11_02805 [Leptospira ilyithenensis]